MVLTRQEQLEFCKYCKNRLFSPKEGIICSITNQKADFKTMCGNYLKDDIAIHREKIFQEENHLRHYPKDFTFGMDKLGVKNGIIAGILLIVLGLIWFIVGWRIGFIFWYPFVMIVMGIISLIVGIINTIIRKKLDNEIKKTPASIDILDN